MADSASTATVTVEVGAAGDAHTGDATVTGEAKLGRTLTAAHTLGDADGLGEVSYRWRRGAAADGAVVWQDIEGATGGAYTPADADPGHPVRVVATFEQRSAFNVLVLRTG